MSKPLILPGHVARARQAERAAATANAITKTALNHLTSDDFVTPDDVRQQLEDLRDYVAQRQEAQPTYRLPSPMGWRLLVLMLTIPETTAGGLHMVDDMREARSMSSPQGVVLEVGPACYQDRSRFAIDGGDLAPWVKVGDRITWKKYDVTMFQIANGQRLGFMNDTTPVGMIDGGWLTEGDA